MGRLANTYTFQIERPFHFSILTLLFSGLALSLYAKYILRSEPNYAPLANSTGNTENTENAGNASAKSFLVDILRYPLQLRSQSPSFALLLFCVVARTILYWRTIRTIHCSWDGLQVRAQRDRRQNPRIQSLIFFNRLSSLSSLLSTISPRCDPLIYRDTNMIRTHELQALRLPS